MSAGVFNGKTAVTYTNSNGCAVSSLLTVNGHVIRPDGTPLCVGNKIILKALDTPRNGSDGGDNWISENLPIATVGNKIGENTNQPVAYVTLPASGTATIKRKDANNCTAQYIINVKGLPTITPDTPAVCPEKSTPLTGSGTAATTSPWTSANTNTATIATNGQATGVNPGNVALTYTDNFGCKATKQLTVKASTISINAGAGKDICPGRSEGVDIGAPAQTGITYSWTPTAGLNAPNISTPKANPTVTTVYRLEASRLTSGSSTSECPGIARVTVTVNPLPAITSAQGTSSHISPNEAIILTASVAGSATANPWATGDVTKVTITPGTPNTSATATGVAVGNPTNITYTDRKGCTGTHAVTVSNKLAQKIEFPDIQTKTMGANDFTLEARSVLTATLAPTNLLISYSTTDTDKVRITVSGSVSSVEILKAGKVSIVATQAGNDTYKPAPNITRTFCIYPAQPRITYTENNKTLTSNAENGNQWYLNGNLIPGATGKTHLATANGDYTLKVTIETCAGAFSAITKVLTIPVAKLNQEIIFTIPTKTVGDKDFTLEASVLTGLPITYHTTNTDKVTIVGVNRVRILKAGKVTIEARQAGNNTYNTANKMITFCINPGTPHISYNESNKTLTSTAPTGNQWYLNGPIPKAAEKTYVATSNGNYVVKVTIEGCSSEFSPAFGVSIPVTKLNQTIKFDPIADKTVDDKEFTLSASTESNLSITFSTTGTTTDKVSIDGKKVKIEKAGKVSIEATQAGDDTYNPATPITQTFCIKPLKPSITYTESHKTLTSSAPTGNQWYVNEKKIDGATEQKFTHPPTEYGSYKVKVTIEECANLSDPYLVVVTGDIAANEWQIFPNPVHDQLVIELPSHENGLISLFSVTGQNLHATAASGKALISMKDFPVGIYILKIQAAGKTVVKKVVRN